MSFLSFVVADADPDRRSVVVGLLRAAGHHVIPVENGPLAGEALAASAADFLVLGTLLPGTEQGALWRVLDPGRQFDPEPLVDVEHRHIALTLEHTGGNRSRAAKLLGISRSTLLAKIRRFAEPGGHGG